jgi:phosphoribosyl-ATP pyrophosphohydrolase
MSEKTDAAAVLERLFATIDGRRGADPARSYSAKLFAKGTEKIAEKLGEEAVETIVAALSGDRRRLAEESADLLYHLLVLWADRGLAPETVWTELARREGISGIAEKKSRGGGKRSTKPTKKDSTP